MGIDGIGKGGAPPSPSGASGTGNAPAAGSAERPFEAQRESVGAKPAVATAEPAALGALDQLRAGRIDVERYVDLKVEEATAHLHGLGKNELSAIKSMLHAQVVSDPALADLVTQAAGTPPSGPKPSAE